MALTKTTLSAAATATTMRFNVTSATGATVGGFIRVDGEFATIVAISGTAIDVRTRGERGGIAVAHDLLAPVTFGLPSDMTVLGVYNDIPLPAKDFDLVNVGQNGVVAVPIRDTVFILNKATALASTTFADPTNAQDGLRVTFVSFTDAAHVLTTVNVMDGTSGANTTLTFAAYAGASISLVAFGAKWLVTSLNAVTPS